MKIVEKIPLLVLDSNKLIGATNQQSKYCLTILDDKFISLYNITNNHCLFLKPRYIYSAITKGEKNNYFVVRKDDYGSIYITNNKFIEIDKINLCVPNKYMGKIFSISYNDKNHKIYIVNSKTLYSVTLDGEFIKEELSKTTKEKISDNIENVVLQRNLHGNLFFRKQNEQIVKITSIGVFSSKLYISYQKDKLCYVSRLNDECDITDTLCIGNNIEIISFLEYFSKIGFLIIKNGSYNYIYISDLICNNSQQIKR